MGIKKVEISVLQADRFWIRIDKNWVNKGKKGINDEKKTKLVLRPCALLSNFFEELQRLKLKIEEVLATVAKQCNRRGEAGLKPCIDLSLLAVLINFCKYLVTRTLVFSFFLGGLKIHFYY